MLVDYNGHPVYIGAYVRWRHDNEKWGLRDKFGIVVLFDREFIVVRATETDEPTFGRIGIKKYGRNVIVEWGEDLRVDEGL